ncbi:hypothetical protein HanRHA438_Chr04g0165961 [Helianthus annuus]|uniref:Uncharacterized protein n=1 Tax=Helianthus annuus TaxID=4232 RepID=A0A9K3J6Y9_HELAN|nr:hypothetical protein HanXRQr2_Chr04g0155841 [Helianthus annuus]KAJ0580337.1 hypothetical protein HanHA300_Chr04g0128081 [Helianthus annuus]KAJ0596282.1 hypothetical protein HanHA89_Chr04g0141011 [Helianthus annuus]KAJ0925992.1 hypothetical protein HanRHA438_Chr04g0165961 [Helianthus annuus]KAJ0930484.1 hypothetical protein HanPSC8_Chr04g0149851 [Helianthus annuus]
MADQLKLDVEVSHKQTRYLSNPPAEHYEEFNSIIFGLNSCRITHALKTNLVICSDMIRDFWLSAKVNRSGAEGAGLIEAKIQEKEIVIAEAVIREVLKFDDQTDHPTSFGRDRVVKALRRMSYEGEDPTVLKKLFPSYWGLFVHVFLLYIYETKGGLDQLNQVQTCTLVALVNYWDYNFSAFVFDNMKSMLENPKKKIFMLYPWFIQMIFDEKYPDLVKSANVHQFLGKYALEKHGKFRPIVGQLPAPTPLNATVAKEHDVQFVGVGVKPDIETEDLVTDDEGIESDMELMESTQAELHVRELPVMNYENLAALIESLKESLGNPPPMAGPTLKEQIQDDVAEDTDLVSHKRQRIDSEPSITDHVSHVAETNPVIRTEPEVEPTVAQDDVIPDFF